MTFPLLLWLFSVLIFVVIFLFWFYRRLTFWSRQHVVQNWLHAASLRSMPMNLADEAAVKKLGKIVGYYEITTPSLIIADPKLINDVLIKNFRKFSDHRKWLPDEHVLNSSLFNVSYHRWLPMRRLFGQVFTGFNLKQMVPLIDKTLNNFLGHLDKKLKTSQEFDMNPFIVGATLDVGTRCIFGLAIDSLDTSGPDAKIVNCFQSLFATDISWVQLLAFLYPKLSYFGVTVFKKDVLDFIFTMQKKYYQQRVASVNSLTTKNQRRDLLQMMIDARGDKESTKEKLTADEITANCIIFTVALFDPISTSLTNMIYNLVKNPEIQEIVANEIRQELDLQNLNLIDKLNNLKELDAFINESMRLLPAVSRVERRATEDCHLTTEEGKQIFIPKDTIVVIPTYAVHRDADNYDNPEEFRLDRFYPENKNMTQKLGRCTFVPFADGPRNCVGKNFGLLVTKTCLAKLMAKYKFVETEKTKFDLHNGRLMNMPKEMVVRVDERN